MNQQQLQFVMIATMLVASMANLVEAQVDANFYLSKVKPLLREKCIACHGPIRTEAGLRLDTATSIKKGSEEGLILDYEHTDQSKILKRIQATSLNERMPPEGEGVSLVPDEVNVLHEWIRNRSPAPEREEAVSGPADHWAFQPIQRTNFPTSSATVGSVVDDFISHEQRHRNLTPLPEADRLTLLRRVTLDLTGLPPTRDEIQSFLADSDSNAYERRIGMLLDRSTYGERWGRHWMDIWRYSDWDGYKDELRGSQRNIWHWRDWIIESLNENKPYDQMIVEMLAGDEIDPLNSKVLRATGFLARNYHKSNRNIWLDATVEHTAKAFVGLTINCAKCHDHKYDPLPQVDYYRFRAIFEPHHVRTDPMHTNPLHTDSTVATAGFPRAYDANLVAPTYLFASGDDKQPVKDHPLESSIPSRLPFPIGFGVASVPIPVASYLPELTPESELAALQQAWKRCDDARIAVERSLARQKESDLKNSTSIADDPIDFSFQLLKLSESEASIASLKLRYAADKAKHLQNDASATERLAASALASEQRWRDVESELRVVTATRALSLAEKDKKKPAIDKAKKELAAAEAAYKKLVASDLSGKLKEYTPIATVYPKQSTGRRLGLARWIVDRQNPLTARVAVNHIWARHFGAPLVENVFDFGMKTPKPELINVLNWLAAELIESGWDMKRLHRILAGTQAYRRASSGPIDLVNQMEKIDPDNQFYWRGNLRRLDAEEVRDSVLAVGRLLDTTMGGPDIDEEQGEKVLRRSLYFRHAYEKQMTMMVMFDTASPSECYQRRPSVIPQQALVLANSQLARTSSRKLASRIWKESSQLPVPFVERLFMETLNRPPENHELSACLEFIAERSQDSRTASTATSKPETSKPETPKPISESPAIDPVERAVQNLAHVLINHSDFVSVR